jgi:hypothetical protein
MDEFENDDFVLEQIEYVREVAACAKTNKHWDSLIGFMARIMFACSVEVKPAVKEKFTILFNEYKKWRLKQKAGKDGQA